MSQSDGKEVSNAVAQLVLAQALQIERREEQIAKLLEELQTKDCIIAELNAKLRVSIDKKYFADLVVRKIENGDIPAPKEILERSLPYSFTCSEEDVSWTRRGISVEVKFDANGYYLTVWFDLEFVPGIDSKNIYPGFAMQYAAPVPKVKKPRRVRVGTVKSGVVAK